MAPVLGALFAILIGILAIRPYIIYQQRSFENIEAANTASQFRQLINAAQLYVQNNCLPTMDGSTGEITPPSTCPVDQSLSGSNYYVVSVDKNLLSTLQSNGYLPQGTTATNPYQQGWSIVVSSVTSSSGGGASGGGSSSNNNIQALLYSTGGQNIPERLAPEIAAETGQEGGFVPYPNQYGSTASNNLAQGAYGHWSTSFPNTSPGEGHLVALLDVGQNGVNDDYSGDYLYRRQVPGDPQANTMQTDLNMDGNNITNAKTVSATTVQVSTSPTTPILAEMLTQTESSGAQEGIVQATGSNGAKGPTVSMQADNGGASLTEDDGFVSGSATTPLVLAEMGTWGAPNSMDPTQEGGMLQLSGPNQENYINMQADKNQSSLEIEGNSNGSTGGLVFISTQESVGCPCNPSASTSLPSGCNAPATSTTIQLGTIAPNTDTTGMPLVCTDPPQSGSLSVPANGGSITITQSSSLGAASWQLLGNQDFTTLQLETLEPVLLNNTKQTGGGIYVNNTHKSLFISSSCRLNDGGTSSGYVTINLWGFQISIPVYGYGSPWGTFGQGTSISFFLAPPGQTNLSSGGTPWAFSGISLDGGVAAPASSIIVPPGYTFAYSLYADTSYYTACPFTIAF